MPIKPYGYREGEGINFTHLKNVESYFDPKIFKKLESALGLESWAQILLEIHQKAQELDVAWMQFKNNPIIEANYKIIFQPQEEIPNYHPGGMDVWPEEYSPSMYRIQHKRDTADYRDVKNTNFLLHSFVHQCTRMVGKEVELEISPEKVAEVKNDFIKSSNEAIQLLAYLLEKVREQGIIKFEPSEYILEGSGNTGSVAQQNIAKIFDEARAEAAGRRRVQADPLFKSLEDQMRGVMPDEEPPTDTPPTSNK